MAQQKTQLTEICFHCGSICETKPLVAEEHTFCCEGCKTVFQILKANNLSDYYAFNTNPGVSLNKKSNKNFDFLDEPGIKSRILKFTNGVQSGVLFKLPSIHCSSCVWLLENLFKLHKGIIRSQVNFLKREAFISYNENEITLKQLADLLYKVGYEPKFQMDDLEAKAPENPFRKYYFKLGVAFFCFGNIMLFSFPDYLGLSRFNENQYSSFFGFMNFLLSLPVLLYSGQEFFKSAINGLRQRVLNMDFPIAFGLLVIFFRSCYEIFWNAGPGYMDTLASLVFLMLIGRMFQNKTYEQLAFDRDYKSYFPVAVTVVADGKEKPTSLENLKVGDRIIIRNQELIPADSILFNGEANIDYAFVTGESVPVAKASGEIIYAGGKQVGGSIELEVVKNVSQSYLTQLWNDDAFTKASRESVTSLATRFSKYFTAAVFAIAIGAMLFWVKTDVSRALNALTGVLIITCPCALSLSSPFTIGNTLRILGRNKIFLKNALTVEAIAEIDQVVFDKTGTLTSSNLAQVNYFGTELNESEKSSLRSLVYQSSHPLSKKIFEVLPHSDLQPVSNFHEFPGKGIEGRVSDYQIKVGSKSFAGIDFASAQGSLNSFVYIEINGHTLGYYSIRNEYRPGLATQISQLSQNGKKLSLISGDNDSELPTLKGYFGPDSELLFNQTPHDKLNFIKNKQRQGHKVMMMGDGLNDSGALKQSDVGIAVADDINNFSPACDGIIEASAFSKLHLLLKFCKQSVDVIKTSFILSLLYNLVGLYFAVQGNMSPLVAAILMPISSVTILLFTTLTTRYLGHRLGLQVGTL